MDDGFARIVYEEQEKAGEEILWDTGPEATRQRGYQIVAGYHDMVAPRIQPLRVETKIEVDFGLPVPIVGRFDLERDESTVDFKTGKTMTRKPKEDWRIQAAVYGEATGKPVEFHSLSASAEDERGDDRDAARIGSAARRTRPRSSARRCSARCARSQRSCACT